MGTKDKNVQQKAQDKAAQKVQKPKGGKGKKVWYLPWFTQYLNSI